MARGRRIQAERLRLPPPDDDLELALRFNPRAKRVLVKIDAVAGGAVLVCPTLAARPRAVAFARENAAWLRRRLATMPASVPFGDGATIALLGRPCRIRHDSDAPLGVRREGDEIRVSGRAEHVARRVGEWLRGEARREIAARAEAMAERLDVRILRITIRDPRTRWGSCSSTGALSFSWRLILAPACVLDYVVAHEVAHLREASHGPAFWALVERLHDDVPGARAWLRREGTSLHRHG